MLLTHKIFNTIIGYITYIVNNVSHFFAILPLLYTFCEILLHIFTLLCYAKLMKINDLVATGLNAVQARTYVFLLEQGSALPPTLAKHLGLTRTNAYKVLDQITDMGLALRKEEKGKYIYYPDNPMALSNLVAEQRNIATTREDAVKHVLKDLLTAYHTHTDQPSTQVVTGRSKVADAYRQQIDQLEPIFFIRSRSDIPVMGFDTMHELRVAPSRHNIKRFGITPDLGTGTTSSNGDDRSNLARTWIKQEYYTAPVEWSVSGSTLLIVLFGSEPHAITITNPVIADAFRQIWHVLDSCLRSMPYYSDLPRKKPNTP